MPNKRISDPTQLQALIDSILLIEADADLDQLLTVITEQATSLVGARYGALGVLNEDGTRLARFITVGLDADERARIGRFPTGRGMLGRVIVDQVPLRVDDLSTQPDRSGFPENHPPMTSFLGVPVRLEGGTVYGNLYLCDKQDGGPFSDTDEALADTLGRVAGLLIDKARTSLQARGATLAEERERMARDLHDTVIQRLFAVGLSLQATQTFDASDDVRQRISGAIDDLDATIREIRSTIFALGRQTPREGVSLRREIFEICDEVTQRLGVDVSVTIEGPIDMLVGDAAASHLVATLREALANVVRHAQSTSAEVSLCVDSGGLTLEVLDHGIGVDESGSPNAVMPGPNGHGISNMTMRAQSLGGWCALSASPEGGSMLTWYVATLGGALP